MSDWNNRRTSLSVFILILFVGELGAPYLCRATEVSLDKNDPSMYERDFVSAISISYSPEIHPFDIIYRRDVYSVETNISMSGSRFLIAPGFRLIFREIGSSVSNGHFYLDIPLSSFSSSFYEDRGGDSGRIDGGVAEFAYGIRFGFSLRVIGSMSASLGFSHEKLHVSYRLAESIYGSGRYVGRTTGSMTVSGDRSGIMPSVLYDVSKNVILSFSAYFATSVVEDNQLFLQKESENEVFESTTKMTSSNNNHVEVGVSFVW